MKQRLHKIKNKAERLLRLYSIWQETRRTATKRRCMMLLRELTAMDPHFSLRHEFDQAF